MDLLGRLHPALSGEFDLHRLLQHAPPQTWRPKEPGERLTGLVWKTGTESNQGGYSYPVLSLIDVDQGLWRVSCAPVSLRKQCEKHSITRGHLITVTFKGTGTTDEGRTYKKFKLERV